ncbi:MAG: hypothetical protein D6762_06150 [Candidatus Neomarinimicrobiota bacterium]|nr:MAG: hypothetical protein D6762_06150 [Candidatus Neomarinimicrobiota bacterium]
MIFSVLRFQPTVRHLISLLLLGGILSAAVPGDSLVWVGVRQFYNYSTAEAIQTLTEARALYPDNPTVHLTWAAALWLHSQAHDPVDQTYEVLENALRDIVPVYQELVERHPGHPVYQLYYGSAIGLQARVDLGKKEWFSTLVHAYRGFRIIQEVAEDHPELMDAQLPIGIVETYASMSSFLVKWSASLFGLEADQEEGMTKIVRAADSGEFSWIEASSVASFLYLWVFNQPEEAYRFSRRLVASFPRNFYFQIMYLESMIRLGKESDIPGKLEELQQYLPQLTPIQQAWYGGYLAYEQGLWAFSRGDITTAHERAAWAVSHYGAELDVILGNAWLLKGMCEDLEGQRSRARTSYQRCLELDNLTTAMDQARTYLKQPFGEQR